MRRPSPRGRSGAEVLRSIFFTSSNRPASSALLWLLAALALTAAVHRDAFFSRPAWPNDGHAALSLHLAVADAYCGKQGRISTGYDLAGAIEKDRRLVRVPLPDVIREIAGSVDAYCASVDREALNNENSLMLVMTWALKIAPRLSAGGLARVFGAIRLVLLALFGFAILLSGASVLLAAAAILTCADVLQDLRHVQYTIYPFLAPLLLGLAGLYVIVLRYSPVSATARWPMWAALGLITAFCANMRSSHVPIYLAFFLIYAVVLARHEAGVLLRVMLPALACFAVAYAGFDWLLIRPLKPAGPHPNRAYHVVAHPLVLGLAVPPSDLSRREGIAWNDEVGLILARRMNPDTTYLGPDYERALFQYYRSLWSRYPLEMTAIYGRKLALAGSGMLTSPETEHQSTARWLARARMPLNGIWLLILYTTALLASALSWRRRRSGLALLVALLSVAAIAVLMEAALIMPLFQLMYHAYLLIYTALLFLLAVQVAADGLSARVQTGKVTERKRP